MIYVERERIRIREWGEAADEKKNPGFFQISWTCGISTYVL